MDDTNLLIISQPTSVYEGLITPRPATKQRRCSNSRCLSLYNKCIWIFIDVFRTVLIIATLTLYKSYGYLILSSFGLLFVAFVITHIYSNKSSVCSIHSIFSLLCGIPMLLVMYIFQHIRFHDYLLVCVCSNNNVMIQIIYTNTAY